MIRRMRRRWTKLPDREKITGMGDITWVNVPGKGRQDLIAAAKRPFYVDVAEAFRIQDRKIRKVEALMVSLPYGQRSPFVPVSTR